MKRIFSTAAATAALFAAMPVGAADNMANYRASLECVSLHVIASQVLGQDADRGEELADMQADEASDYFAFAQASRPSLSKDQIDADLSAQMDEDYASVTAPGADIDAFLGARVPSCQTLKRQM